MRTLAARRLSVKKFGIAFGICGQVAKKALGYGALNGDGPDKGSPLEFLCGS